MNTQFNRNSLVVGDRFSRLEVIAHAPSRNRGASYFLCRCDCGTEKEVRGTHLTSNATVSCGCKQREELRAKRFIDHTGKRFGSLEVITFSEARKRTSSNGARSYWLCKCDCGAQQIIVEATKLTSGRTTSCGCKKRNMVKTIARKQGQPRYLGKICKTHPHLQGERYTTVSGLCVACDSENRRVYFKQPKHREWCRTRRLQRRKTEPQYRAREVLRGRLRKAIQTAKAKKMASTDVLVGCNVVFLMKYLESKFVPGMTWDNHGPVWHIDHIIPIAAFNLMQEEEQRKCFHFTNLQPLFGLDNLRKGAGTWRRKRVVS